MRKDLDNIVNTFKLLHEIKPGHVMDIYTTLSNNYFLKHEKQLNEIYNQDNKKYCNDTGEQIQKFYQKQNAVIYRTVRAYKDEIRNTYLGR